MINPAVAESPKMVIALVARRFERMRHTLKRMPNNMKERETERFIILFFIRGYQQHVCVKSRQTYIKSSIFKPAWYDKNQDHLSTFEFF